MILTGDCRDILPTLDAESVDCCVTSPPYALGLRNYGNIPNQIGNAVCPKVSQALCLGYMHELAEGMS